MDDEDAVDAVDAERIALRIKAENCANDPNLYGNPKQTYAVAKAAKSEILATLDLPSDDLNYTLAFLACSIAASNACEYEITIEEPHLMALLNDAGERLRILLQNSSFTIEECLDYANGITNVINEAAAVREKMCYLKQTAIMQYYEAAARLAELPRRISSTYESRMDAAVRKSRIRKCETYAKQIADMKSQLAIHVEMVRTMARTTSNTVARMLLSRRAWNARRATNASTCSKRNFEFPGRSQGGRSRKTRPNKPRKTHRRR